MFEQEIEKEKLEQIGTLVLSRSGKGALLLLFDGKILITCSCDALFKTLVTKEFRFTPLFLASDPEHLLLKMLYGREDSNIHLKQDNKNELHR